MQGDWLSRRVTLVEQRVDRLDGLPGEVTALRQDMNTQFVALRADMDAGFVAVRAEMDAGFVAVRADMDVRFDAVHQVLISLQTQITDNQRTLEATIGDNRRYALVLHEEVISRIATLGEGRERPRPRKKR